MSSVSLVVVRLALEGERVVGVLRTFLVNNFIWTPILKALLISCFDGVRWSLMREVCLARGFGIYFEALKPSLVLSFTFNLMRIDDLMLFFDIEWLKVM